MKIVIFVCLSLCLSVSQSIFLSVMVFTRCHSIPVELRSQWALYLMTLGHFLLNSKIPFMAIVAIFSYIKSIENGTLLHNQFSKYFLVDSPIYLASCAVNTSATCNTKEWKWTLGYLSCRRALHTNSIFISYVTTSSSLHCICCRIVVVI